MTRKRELVGRLPIVASSKKHELLLFLRSNGSKEMTLERIISMNPKMFKDARRTREDLSEAAKAGLVKIVDRDVYRITDYGVKVLYALAARRRGVMLAVPTP